MPVVEIDTCQLRAKLKSLGPRELEKWIAKQENDYYRSLPTPETINNSPGNKDE